MGSYRNAVMTGFICRLCSEQKKCVIHLYSRKGVEMSLMKKIALLPIKVEKYDFLPKTVCEACIEKINMQYNLLQKITRSMQIHRIHNVHEDNCPSSCPLHQYSRSSRTTPEESGEEGENSSPQSDSSNAQTIDRATETPDPHIGDS